MRACDVFVGNLIEIKDIDSFKEGLEPNNDCYPYEIYRSTVVLVKKKNYYYDIMNNFKKYTTEANENGDIIVDEFSLQPYINEEDKDYNKFYTKGKMRMKVILDPRLPIGINY